MTERSGFEQPPEYGSVNDKPWSVPGFPQQGIQDWEAANPGKSKYHGSALKVLAKEAFRY